VHFVADVKEKVSKRPAAKKIFEAEKLSIT